MISPEEAWQRIEDRLRPPATARIPRTDAAGYVLAEPLDCTVDVPAHNVSSMDGYALPGAVEAGTALPVAGTVAAGQAPGTCLAAGTAMRIMTGAPVPEGCDRVVPVEETEEVDGKVSLKSAVEPGAWIRRRGEVLEHGDRLLDTGALLTPGALALIATHGYGDLTVVARPSVAILTTGDEVVPPDATAEPGQLRDSHTDFLTSAVSSLGIEGRSLGIAPDNIDVLCGLVEEALGNDVLILTGGVSMGEFDLVEGVLEGFGCEALFHAIAIQPGKPMVAAVHDRGLVFALPGNPASAMVCYWLLVRPALRRLMGLVDGFWNEALAARLTDDLPGARRRDRFLPARVRLDAGEIAVSPIAPMGSHDLASYAQGTALVRVRAGSSPRSVGEKCEILPLVNLR